MGGNRNGGCPKTTACLTTVEEKKQTKEKKKREQNQKEGRTDKLEDDLTHKSDLGGRDL